jgi:hypothetical protein
MGDRENPLREKRFSADSAVSVDKRLNQEAIALYPKRIRYKKYESTDLCEPSCNGSKQESH